MPWANEEKEDHTMCEQTQMGAPLLCKENTSLWPITQSQTWSTGQETAIRTSPKGYLGVGGKSRLEPQITNQKGCTGQKGGRATPPLGSSRVPTKTLWDLLILWTPGRSFPSLRPSKSLMKNSGVCTVLCRVGRNNHKAVRLGPPRHALPSCHLSLSPLQQQRLLPSKSEALQSIDLRHLQSRLRLLGSPAAVQTFEVTVPEAV